MLLPKYVEREFDDFLTMTDLNTISYGWNVVIANVRNWSPLAANDVGFSRAVVQDERRRVLCCLWMTFFKVIQFASESAAHIPPPRLNLTCIFSVFVPNSKSFVG
ncbi:hypothetical protein [Agaribacter flavus]|uniref:Uncharacterized protein n=1 Tax=Agaribacter flavus TaxID=1902781 RepID=A0ABV7FK69_9ALTE